MACMHICHACIQASINAVILAGVHASMSNIDDDGCFIQDEAFELPGTTVFRKAGASRALMEGWLKLRDSCLEADYIDYAPCCVILKIRVPAQ